MTPGVDTRRVRRLAAPITRRLAAPITRRLAAPITRRLAAPITLSGTHQGSS